MTTYAKLLEPDRLSDKERMHRIAELLCIAVMLAEANRAVRIVAPANITTSPATNVATVSDDATVLSYLRLTGQASPLAIRRALGLNRSAIYRSLLRLSREGQVVASGQTRTLVYRLKQAEPSPEQIARN